MKRRVLLFITLSFFLLCGCNLNLPFKHRNQKTNNSIAGKNTKQQDSKDKGISYNKYLSQFTGEPVDKDTLNEPAFMAIIENSKPSRPQYGINYADIVYETTAEGGIPRFMAVFQKNSCKKIGPIRSARNYFINLSNEYNLPFAHCGGSEEALNRIKKQGELSINEIPNPRLFFRDKKRKPPHNLYTSSSSIKKFIETSSYPKSSKVVLNFDGNYWDNPDLNSVKKVIINLNKNYNTNYDFKDGKYLKSMDNSPSIDALDNSRVYADTIVIQQTDITLQNDGLHLNVTLVGNGIGYIISNGKYKKISWEKKDKYSNTILIDESGKQVPLHPGKTFWHIIDKKSIVNLN